MSGDMIFTATGIPASLKALAVETGARWLVVLSVRRDDRRGHGEGPEWRLTGRYATVDVAAGTTAVADELRSSSAAGPTPDELARRTAEAVAARIGVADP